MESDFFWWFLHGLVYINLTFVTPRWGRFPCSQAHVFQRIEKLSPIVRAFGDDPSSPNAWCWCFRLYANKKHILWFVKESLQRSSTRNVTISLVVTGILGRGHTQHILCFWWYHWCLGCIPQYRHLAPGRDDIQNTCSCYFSFFCSSLFLWIRKMMKHNMYIYILLLLYIIYLYRHQVLYL